MKFTKGNVAELKLPLGNNARLRPRKGSQGSACEGRQHGWRSCGKYLAARQPVLRANTYKALDRHLSQYFASLHSSPVDELIEWLNGPDRCKKTLRA
jgi:hypothetical protein